LLENFNQKTDVFDKSLMIIFRHHRDVLDLHAVPLTGSVSELPHGLSLVFLSSKRMEMVPYLGNGLKEGVAEADEDWNAAGLERGEGFPHLIHQFLWNACKRLARFHSEFRGKFCWVIKNGGFILIPHV